jgi:hypothetical protein
MELDSYKRALAEEHLNAVLSGGGVIPPRPGLGAQGDGDTYGAGGYRRTLDTAPTDDPWALEAMALADSREAYCQPPLGVSEEVQRLAEIRNMKVAQVRGEKERALYASATLCVCARDKRPDTATIFLAPLAAAVPASAAQNCCRV